MRPSTPRIPLPRTPAGRAALAVVAVAAAFNLVVVLADLFAPTPAGPPSSSFTTKPRGVAAWAELARRRGIAVRALRASPSPETLPQTGTLVVLEPRSLLPAEGEALRAFADRGGTVVAGGRSSAGWLVDLIGAPDDLRWSSSGPRDVPVVAPAGLSAGTRALRTAGEGRWRETATALPLAATDAGAVAAAVHVGSGRLVLIADPSPLQNRLLDEADNAAFALSLSGGGPLTFVESVHGYGETRGLAALPQRIKWALALLGLAAVALMVARGRRFGPPEAPERDLPPPRRDYVDALAATLARGHRQPERAEAVLAAARERARRAGVRVPDTNGRDA